MESLNLGPIFTAKLIKCGGRFGGDLSDLGLGLGLGFPGKSFFGESLIPQERSVGMREREREWVRDKKKENLKMDEKSRWLKKQKLKWYCLFFSFLFLLLLVLFCCLFSILCCLFSVTYRILNLLINWLKVKAEIFFFFNVWDWEYHWELDYSTSYGMN